MADIGINYDANTSPSHVGAQFGLAFSGNTLKAKILSLDNFAITLRPSGNVSEQILSGVAWPLAQTIGAVLPSLARNLVYGYSFDVMSVGPSSQNVEGETLTVGLGDLALSNFNGMLLVRGTVSVS
jgi:hypothetical protein